MSIFRIHTMLPNKINKTYTITGTVVNGWDDTKSLPQTSVFVGNLEIEITNGYFSYQLTTALSILKSISIFITCVDLDGLQYEKELFFDENLLSGTVYNLGDIVLTSDDLVSNTIKLTINGFTGYHNNLSGLGYEDALPDCNVKLYIGEKLKALTTSDRNGLFTLIVDKVLTTLPNNSYIISNFVGNISNYHGIVSEESRCDKDNWGAPITSVAGLITHNNVRLIH